jgi:NADH-quinone oxidoreductase subunit L
MLASFAVSVMAVLQLAGLEPDADDESAGDRLPDCLGMTIDVSFRVDQLSAVMILVITGIGSLIHIYRPRMHDESDSGSLART